MGQFILALHAGHNASAAIGEGGRLLFATQEERITREKNYWGFPRHAIRACLEHVHATPRDLLTVAYGGNQVLSRYHSRDDVLEAYRRQGTLVGKIRQRILMPIALMAAPQLGQRTLSEDLKTMGIADVPVVHYDHHLTHALTAYYGLRKDPFEKVLVATCDGAGDGLCATVRVMGGGTESQIASTHWDHSLGSLYSWMTYLMGFVPLEHEYKLMGMAPYASSKAATETAQMFRDILGLAPDGLGFQKKTRERTNDLGNRLLEAMQLVRFDHLCAGLQLFTEELLMEWIRNAVRHTNVTKVLAAGGVFMNVKANKKIAALSDVTSFEAFPSCGDETLPLGAFWAESAKRFGHAEVKPLDDFYLGDDLDPVATEAAVRTSGFAFERPADPAEAVATLIAAGKPVARAVGRMEFGARALGNRSILADPSQSDVVRVINQMVKKRDFWMPFAPIVLESRQDRYLHNDKHLQSPYMMMTFDSRDNFRELIAAVHNADLTCRAQLLRENQNPALERILETFEKKTGRAVLLNTSFNLHGLPIVRTAEDALFVLAQSGLEHLEVGPFLVHKNARS